MIQMYDYSPQGVPVQCVGALLTLLKNKASDIPTSLALVVAQSLVCRNCSVPGNGVFSVRLQTPQVVTCHVTHYGGLSQVSLAGLTPQGAN